MNGKRITKSMLGIGAVLFLLYSMGGKAGARTIVLGQAVRYNSKTTSTALQSKEAVPFLEAQSEESKVTQLAQAPAVNSTIISMVTPPEESSTVLQAESPTVSELPAVTPPASSTEPLADMILQQSEALTITPNVNPTEAPTPEATIHPTEAPTPEPTIQPTEAPTPEPTIQPTEVPTPEPTIEPTPAPTPTVKPSKTPAPTTKVDTKKFKKTVYFINTGKIYARSTVKSKVLGTGIKYRAYKTDGVTKGKGKYTRILINDTTVGYTKTSNLTKKKPTTNIVQQKGAYYTYENMRQDLLALKDIYPEYMTVKNMGKTADKRNLYCVVLGNPKAKKQIVLTGSIHAREYMNSYFIMEMLEKYLNHYKSKSKKIGVTYEALFNKVALYIVPMVNPDGVTISQLGPSKIRNTTLRKNIVKILGKTSYKRWKANARGVDINRNCPYGWEHNSLTKPTPYYYGGKSAASEKETRALIKLVNQLKNPVAVINYHSQGSIIYWDYLVSNKLKPKFKKMAVAVQKLTGYKLMHNTSKTKEEDGCGGFGDWCAYAKSLPTVTIETGTGVCPLSNAQYKSIYTKNQYVIEVLVKQFY